MKIPRQDLHIIRSIANDLLRDTVKDKSLDAHEFTALCWIRAINHRLNLNIQVEIPDKRLK